MVLQPTPKYLQPLSDRMFKSLSKREKIQINIHDRLVNLQNNCAMNMTIMHDKNPWFCHSILNIQIKTFIY